MRLCAFWLFNYPSKFCWVQFWRTPVVKFIFAKSCLISLTLCVCNFIFDKTGCSNSNFHDVWKKFGACGAKNKANYLPLIHNIKACFHASGISCLFYLYSIVKRKVGFQCGNSGILDEVVNSADEDIAFRLSLIHISEPTRHLRISYAVFCLKKKKCTNRKNESV